MRNSFSKVSSLIVILMTSLLNAMGKEPDTLPLPTVHEHGYWSGENTANAHVFDPTLAIALTHFFQKEEISTLVDFGCGMGDYVKTFLENQINCKGYDGNPNTPELSGGVAEVLDLSQSFDLQKRFDWVLTLEVGEHLPKQYEETFLKNLDKHNVHGIVLSWALKRQGGLRHFNEQDNSYIKEIMGKYGYINDRSSENELRQAASLPWFKKTIMVFRKK